MKKLSGGRAWGRGLVKYAKQARKGSKGRGKFDKVRLEWEDREEERERERRREEGRGRGKAEVLAMPYPTLLLYFSSNISNIDSRPKKAQQTSFPPTPSLSLFRSRCAVQTAMFAFWIFDLRRLWTKIKISTSPILLSLSLSRSRYWCFLLNSRVSLGYLLRYTPLRDSVSYEKNWRSGSKKK